MTALLEKLRAPFPLWGSDTTDVWSRFAAIAEYIETANHHHAAMAQILSSGHRSTADKQAMAKAARFFGGESEPAREIGAATIPWACRNHTHGPNAAGDLVCLACDPEPTSTGEPIGAGVAETANTPEPPPTPNDGPAKTREEWRAGCRNVWNAEHGHSCNWSVEYVEYNGRYMRAMDANPCKNCQAERDQWGGG